MGFMSSMHTNCDWGNHIDWLSSSYTQTHVPGPKIRVWWLIIALKSNFCTNFMGFMVGFHGFSWIFMGFMGFIHTNCGWVNHLDWLSSSYTQIHVPWPKIGVQQLKIVTKPNFWPNFMGFKVGFHGFNGFSAHKMCRMYDCGPFAFLLCQKPCDWVKNVVLGARNTIILEKPIFWGVWGLKYGLNRAKTGLKYIFLSKFKNNHLVTDIKPWEK